MAKIPTILEAGRADGKLATSGAIFDENKDMFQSEINDIQDTLNSDNPNKPLSAKQGKVLKELLDAKVIEAGAVPIDSEPIEGNITHLVNSDGLAKEFNKHNTEIILGSIYDVSSHNKGIVFESLQSLLSSSNLSTLIPTSVRHGGMSIRFIQNSDNKYVQYRLMSQKFSTIESDWQGVDNEPTDNSENLVKSGGVTDSILQNCAQYGYDIPVIIKNHYIKKTGEILVGVGNNFCVSPMIEVNEGDTFIIKNALSLFSSQSYALYDANKNFVSSSQNANAILVIPSGVKYIAFSRNTNEKGYVCKKAIDNYTALLFNANLIEYTLSAYINASGQIVSLSTYAATEFITVRPSQILYIEGDVSAGSGKLYAFYTADKTLISTGTKPGIVKVPENAVYVVASSEKTAEYYIKLATTEYTDYAFENFKVEEPLNSKIGDTNFYANKANVGYSIGAVVPNYILIKVQNVNKAIVGIQFKINTFELSGVYKDSVNVLAYFYHNTDTNDYSSICKTGKGNIKLHYLIKDSEFYIAIEKGTILNRFSGIYVDTLFSYYTAPNIVNKDTNVIISTADSIDDFTVVYSYDSSYDNGSITDLLSSYSVLDEANNTLAFSTYPVKAYTSWTDNKTGALVIKFPPFSKEVFITFDIQVYRYHYAGCTIRVSGFLTNLGMQEESYAKVIDGKIDTIYGKVRLGYLSDTNQVCVILGDTNSTWNFTNFIITNVKTQNQNTQYPIVSGWDYSFETNLDGFNVKNVDFTIDENILPQIPASKIIGLGAALNQLSQYCDVNYIRTKLSKFYKSIYAKEKNTPYNLLFLGDSITNFQNGWASGTDKTLPNISNDKPLCMYNKDTFTNRLWTLLNPNALDRANRDKVYGGNMTFIKATANEVTKSGTWINGYDYSTNNYVIPALGGSTEGIKDFVFSVEGEAYLEFTIPANSKGFSIVTEIKNGTRTYNDISYTPSENVEVYLDGSLLDTISMIPNSSLHFQKRFDFVISNPTSSTRTVKILNKDNEKWVFIWGIESWIDTCVRPINNAYAGSSMFTGNISYNNNIACYEPDLIIHEANLLNDTRIDLIEIESYYEDIFTRVKASDIPILVLVTHAPASTSSTITVDPNKCPNIEDVNQTPRYYNQYCAMIKRVCGRHDIPYINVFQYQYDKYNGIIPSSLFVDGIHLSEEGHNMYKTLINYALENNF